MLFLGMRYLINIIGPQAVGKTTVIEELRDYLPIYSVLAIDDFRKRFDSSTPMGEMQAWAELLRRANSNTRVIIESSGTSNNLLHVIGGISTWDDVKMFNIELTANPTVTEKRKQQRQWQGYLSPTLYFDAGTPFFRQAVIPVMASINTEKEQPYEIAAHIIDLLPAEFI